MKLTHVIFMCLFPRAREILPQCGKFTQNMQNSIHKGIFTTECEIQNSMWNLPQTPKGNKGLFQWCIQQYELTHLKSSTTYKDHKEMSSSNLQAIFQSADKASSAVNINTTDYKVTLFFWPQLPHRFTKLTKFYSLLKIFTSIFQNRCGTNYNLVFETNFIKT